MALRFLKSHYKFRPRTGGTMLKVNQRAEGGLIIDGLLSFRQEDDKEFVATVEATSYLTREEVRYKIQRQLLAWDATAVGFVVVAILFTMAHLRDWMSVPVMGGLLVWIGIVVLSILFFHLIYRLLFSRLRRYRYIYAIEQFKRYDADEQWIAIGEDVFPNSEDPFFHELRDQCIFHGFGLLVIDQQLRPQVQITPSRVDLFASKRRAVEFFSLDELTRRLQEMPGSGQLKGWWERLPWQRMGDEAERLLRFRQAYNKQLLICCMAFVVLITLFALEMEERPIHYVNEKTYEALMEQRKEELDDKREPLGYLIDSSFVSPFRPGIPHYLRVADSAQIQPVEPVRPKPGLITTDQRGQLIAFNCATLLKEPRPRFALAYEIYQSEKALRDAIMGFQEKKLDARGLWLGCFSPVDDDFVLFVQQLYTTREEAENDLPALQSRLEQAGFMTPLQVLPLP